MANADADGNRMRLLADADPSANAGGTDDAATDIRQLRAENDFLKTTIRQTEAHRQITGELKQAGARSPELLFNAVKAELEFTDDGGVSNALALVTKLRKSFPEQFGSLRPASIDAGAGRNVGNALTREALAKMKPAEIAKLDWAEVKRVLAAG